MIDQNDWRLQGQERYLLGAKFIKRKYAPCPVEWDHDHCKFCFEKFSLRAGDLHEGYATPDNYRWICETCFNDFRELFRFELLPDIEPEKPSA